MGPMLKIVHDLACNIDIPTLMQSKAICTIYVLNSCDIMTLLSHLYTIGFTVQGNVKITSAYGV